MSKLPQLLGALSILLIAAYFIPTGVVVSTPGELISATEILEPTINQGSISIPTVYVRTRVLAQNSLNANIYMYLNGLLDRQETRTPIEELLKQEDTYQELLSQQEFGAHIIPLTLAFNTANATFWITGEGVIVLADDEQSQLQEGDLILGANGKSITSLDELLQQEFLDGYISVVFLRDGQQQALRNVDITHTILTTYNPEIGSATPLRIKAERPYVGRSADLALALYAYEVLTEPLTNCRVAATGALQPNGSIQQVLGISSKLYTAENIDYMLIPDEEYPQRSWEFEVLRVHTFSEAIATLQTLEC